MQENPTEPKRSEHVCSPAGSILSLALLFSAACAVAAPHQGLAKGTGVEEPIAALKNVRRTVGFITRTKLV